jgi:hypothetical protein
MSETFTLDDKEYNIDDLSEVGQRALSGYRVAQQKIDSARIDFELATAARDYFGNLVKEAVANDTEGTN